MDVIYYFASAFLVLLLVFGPILLIAFTIRPKLVTKLTKKNYKRKKIILRGILSLIVSLVVLGTLVAVFEPASVKAERLARDKAESAQKAAIEKKRLESLKPVKKLINSKSKITFKTTESEDASLLKGEKKTSVEGMDGESMRTYEVTYIKGIEVGRKLIKNEVIKPAVDKVVAIGTYVAPAPIEPTTTYSAPVQSASPSTSSAYYANCTDARNAGAAPIYAGQPGYRSALDRDHDGVACE